MIGPCTRTGATAVSAELLEREAELEAVDASIERARTGRGSVLLVEGPPGIGKTALLEAARERAAEDGFTSLNARGSELEDEFAFGVARQLFERPVVELRDDQREEALSGAAQLASPLFDAGVAESPQPGEPAEIFPLLHGLHWLCANLAVDEPLLLAVDDVHWADPHSLQFLHYLAARIDELPVLVTACARSTSPEAPVELIEAMRSTAAVSSIAPPPLSEAGAEELLAATLTQQPERAFARAAWQASGGNPFLLTELARTLAEEGIAPVAASVDRVTAITPQAIANSVLIRIGRMPDGAAEIARAAAVLGDGADPGAVAALSGLEIEAVEEAADTLTAGGVLDDSPSLRFTHPLVRTAIYDDLPANERGRMHARAAAALDELGADPEGSAGHLLRVPRGGEEARLPLLRQAGAAALTRGAPGAAAAFLGRALEEGPRGPDRRTVLAELGRAEVRAAIPAGIEHLAEATELSEDADERGELARATALALGQGARVSEGAELLTAELEATPGPPRNVRLDLQCDLVGTLLFDFDTDPRAVDAILEEVEEGPPTRSRAERGLLAARAYRLVQLGHDAERAAQAARQALDEGLLDEFPPGGPIYHCGVEGLICAGALEDARAWAGEGLRRARATAILIGIAQSASLLSLAALREGHVAEAEAAGDEAVRVARGHGLTIGLPHCLSSLIDPMIERGRAEAAWNELKDLGMTGELPDFFGTSFLVESRGRLRAARGDREGARDDLLQAGRHYERWGVIGPGLSAWRSHAALIQLQLGESDEAMRLASEELELARRFGEPRAVGISLRTLGLVESGERGLELLAEAVEALAASPDRLEHARALVDLGAALRRGNRRAEGRKRLREGLDLAARCGAVLLAEHARDELLATGARPRKPFYSGLESLTASELRTARMAAEGMTNREIAQALFVTQKTVETHLRHAYQKLDISGRSELAAVLEGAEATG